MKEPGQRVRRILGDDKHVRRSSDNMWHQKWMRTLGIGILGLAIWAGWMVQSERRHHRPIDTAQAVVCIDPGHPTLRAPGQAPQHGTTELDINWTVANRVAKLLGEDPRIRVVMTKSAKDQLVSNPDRAIAANDAGANVILHLHCDAGADRGFTVYYPDREGKDLNMTGPPKALQTASKEAAEAIHQSMAESLGSELRDRGLRGESYTRAGRANGGLTYSIWSRVPSVTVEMVFLSNPDDAMFIKTARGQRQMAQALADGVWNYLESKEVIEKNARPITMKTLVD